MKRALLNLLFFPVMTLLAIVGVTAIVFAWDELDNACRIAAPTSPKL